MLKSKLARNLLAACLFTLPAPAAAGLPDLRSFGESGYRARLAQLGLGPRVDGLRAVPDGPAWRTLSTEEKGWLVTRLRRMEVPVDVWLRETRGADAERFIVRGAGGGPTLTADGRAAALRSLTAPPGRPALPTGMKAAENGRHAGPPVDVRLSPRAAAARRGPAASAPAKAKTRAASRRIEKMDSRTATKVRRLSDGELLMLQQDLEDARRWRWLGYATLVGTAAGVVATVMLGQALGAILLSMNVLAAVIAIVNNELRIRGLKEKMNVSLR